MVTIILFFLEKYLRNKHKIEDQKKKHRGGRREKVRGDNGKWGEARSEEKNSDFHYYQIKWSLGKRKPMTSQSLS